MPFPSSFWLCCICSCWHWAHRLSLHLLGLLLGTLPQVEYLSSLWRLGSNITFSVRHTLATLCKTDSSLRTFNTPQSASFTFTIVLIGFCKYFPDMFIIIYLYSPTNMWSFQRKILFVFLHTWIKSIINSFQWKNACVISLWCHTLFHFWLLTRITFLPLGQHVYWKMLLPTGIPLNYTVLRFGSNKGLISVSPFFKVSSALLKLCFTSPN